MPALAIGTTRCVRAQCRDTNGHRSQISTCQDAQLACALALILCVNKYYLEKAGPTAKKDIAVPQSQLSKAVCMHGYCRAAKEICNGLWLLELNHKPRVQKQRNIIPGTGMFGGK